ncbi:CDP-glycerol glycerophosphotransferase family protein [Methanobacterium congolense]|uniref:Putative polyribitolphosphotransferase n=1 Tax=Methanobacterium congolense TaxID=118062 RepID=A0A1D3L3D8_9EURY|nr:CDP-glycerol glycerophosphotransferase family protein [Methanobacterium congolense]SCG86086.1 putative polyribitolphosphotransferase [Methanobacterium congolense]
MNKYKTFASFFNFFRIFQVKNHKVSFIGWREPNLRGNLGYVHREFEKIGDFNYNFIYKDEYKISDVKSPSDAFKKIFGLFKLFILKSYHLATSRYIFLSDNFLPMAFMNIPQKTVVVQLWHASGAFKKFGFSSVTDNGLRELEKGIIDKMDYVIVSSNNVAPFYEEAFGVSEEKVLALGIPRTDFYFENNDKNSIKNLRNNFENRYPQMKDKKVILYAPTFRDDPSVDREIISNFNTCLFKEELSEYCVMIRLHPLMNQGDLQDNEEFIDVTDYPDEKDLLLLADVLITDYSSIMVEYALLNKPIIFYPYDYEYYVKEERGFYFDYMDTVPGPIAHSPQDIVKIIKEEDYDFDKIKEFTKIEFDYLDGKSTHRVINYILTNHQ